MKKIDDLDLKNKKVLIRVDFNVPMWKQKIRSDVRIREAIPTIKKVLEKGAAVILLSHLGRPKEGVYDKDLSLEPIAERLSGLLGQSIRFEKNWVDGVDIQPGEVVLCENVRFNLGEKENDENLVKKMANLCDVFINDAFATAHRKQASTYGVAQYVKEKAAGLLLERELKFIGKAIQTPERPLVTVVGGAKISTKLDLIISMLDFSDTIIVGGGIANTLLAAKGYAIGKSLCEKKLIKHAKELIEKAMSKNVQLPLPIDVIVAKDCFANTTKTATVKNITDITKDDAICDIGPKTLDKFAKIIGNAKTIIWNGPVGAFELELFANGTKRIATEIANSKAYSLVGGGDTIVALEKLKLTNKMSYISTGGGAFLAHLEAAREPYQLPAVEILD